MADANQTPDLVKRLLGQLVSRKVLFALAALGLAAGLVSAYVSAQPVPSQPPAYRPASNPYANGIYANGIIESLQAHGSNITIFPEVNGPIVQLMVAEGDSVRAGTPLVKIDDSIQRQTTAQEESQVIVAAAQIASAQATLKTLSDTFAKQQQSYATDPQSISKDVIDSSRNAVIVAQKNLQVAQAQYLSAQKTAAAGEALLGKYTIRAPVGGRIMSVESNIGSYVSTQGAYDPYTQSYLPLIVMGPKPDQMEVRVYVDEILIDRLPSGPHMQARMFVRGSNIEIPLTYERIQPYVSPKIELSDQRLEQVDVRVLPIIFSFKPPVGRNIYPGQLVDVYIGTK